MACVTNDRHSRNHLETVPVDMSRLTRRTYLVSLGAVAVAGCIGRGDESADDSDPGDDFDPDDPPLADRELPLPDDTATLSDSIVSGGVPQDGIPSIDDPAFLEAEDADGLLEAGEPIFGVEVDGDRRAYPQRVLVWHEIVNDEVGGESVAVTYCPLTGTAQGFARGETEFGVSGNLLNSNLVMYDRASESYWPQMLATAIRGEFEGEVLREFPVTWTSWERWREAHPDTTVLSDNTGYARNYDDDPYGSYDPPAGHYADDSLPFAPYSSVDEDRFRLKDVVLGARSEDGAVAVDKESLAEAGILEGAVGDVPYLAVYDPDLETGYIYRNPEDEEIEYDDGTVTVDGDRYDPDDLPLEGVLRYDAFWFAWAGYYPDTEVLE
ncbi:DUF3179 domain-containing protein [Natrialbaceae archaeon A-gly3]